MECVLLYSSGNKITTTNTTMVVVKNTWSFKTQISTAETMEKSTKQNHSLDTDLNFA